ncbi:MAG: uroporphyrinogen-III synthase [Vicinamibacteria bacterium]|nr:uroporphyrinogen-III synthase [Vicinamibacteria bacterium]
MTGAGPLSGLRVRVTRPAAQAAPLVAALEALGARVEAGALIEIAPPADIAPLDLALRALATFDSVVFGSANAVAAVADRCAALRLAAAPRALAAVGSATAAAARSTFPGVPLVQPPADAFHAEGLLAELVATGVAGRRFFLPLSDRARPVLAAGLRVAGAEVTAVVAYRTVTAPGAGAGASADLVVLASPSAVQAWIEVAGVAAQIVPVAVIGPVTASAARAASLSVVAVAQPSTNEGLLAAITAWASRS